MKKTPTIFNRNLENMKEVLNTKHKDCEWVFRGEGTATRKYDGTCCLVKEGKLWKRREVKQGKRVPENFELVDHDKVTGKSVGWVPVTDEGEDVWHRAAFVRGSYPDGTYELCGPKVQGNPEGLTEHILIPHKEATVYSDVVRTFDGLKSFFSDKDIEGIVFHHPDGRMAKIKKRDFGLARKH